MDSQDSRTPSDQLPPGEPAAPAPKKRFQLKRFQIEKLEDRIAPGKSGTSSGIYTLEKHCTKSHDASSFIY